MAGINPNLGNLKLQNLQLSKTAEVDTQKAEGEDVGNAKPSAVWILYDNQPGMIPNGGYNPKDGDVLITIRGDEVFYSRLLINEKGERIFEQITADEIKPSDYEDDRGHIRDWRSW